MISLPFFLNRPGTYPPASQQGCPYGYSPFQISSAPPRYGCRPQASQYQLYSPQYYGYNYPTPTESGDPATCVAEGGLWDSFANACTGWAGQQSFGYANYPQGPIPNVIGLDKWGGIGALNGQGYEVWLLQEDGVFGGTPPGYNPRRADIVVMNGRIVAVQVG